MANKAGKGIIIMIVFGMSLIISIPVFIISTTLSAYGKIIKSIPFYYKPSSSSFMKELNIVVDLGNIEIKYITEPVDYCIRIEIY
jgi:hypothetical protein